jgi:hypothetical protein
MIKLTDLIKKENKLNESIVEPILEILASALLYGVFQYVIPTVMNNFKVKADYRKFLKSIPAKWLMKLDTNTNFKKYIYHTIKNDNKLKEFSAKLSSETNDKKKASISFDKWYYEGELVKRWLNSKPAQDELDNVIKQAYPDKGPNDKYPIKLLIFCKSSLSKPSAVLHWLHNNPLTQLPQE